MEENYTISVEIPEVPQIPMFDCYDENGEWNYTSDEFNYKFKTK